MPLRPSRRPPGTRPADTLWQPSRPGERPGERGRISGGRIGRVTHDDLMPPQINRRLLVPAAEACPDRASRQDYLGTYHFDERFIVWLSAGPLPQRVREERLRPGDWWQSAYYISRVEAGCGRDAARAVVTLHQIRAAFRDWCADVWDSEDDDAFARQEQRRDQALARLAATTCGGGHDVQYLDRLARKLEAYVWQTIFPSNRQRKQAPQGREVRSA